MLPPPVTADLAVIQGHREVAVELRVHAPSPRALRWTLSAATRSSGGVSRTRQEGATDGADPDPVARLVFGSGASGLLQLTVSDSAGVEVQRTCRFGDSSWYREPPC